MNDAQEEAEAYPESWDEAAQAAAESDIELKLKHGDNIRVHILSGPLTYREDYFSLGDKGKDGKQKKTRIAVPFGNQIPGYKLKVKHLVEVVVLDGPAKGQNKLFTFGKQVADDLIKVKSGWGSARTPDIILSREGSTKDDTRYAATAVPATIDPKSVPVKFNLEREARFSNKETIDKLPPPQVGREDSLAVKASPQQVDLMNNLSKQKEVSEKELQKMISRKFEGKSKDTLTMGEASAVIDLLKTY